MLSIDVRSNTVSGFISSSYIISDADIFIDIDKKLFSVLLNKWIILYLDSRDMWAIHAINMQTSNMLWHYTRMRIRI